MSDSENSYIREPIPLCDSGISLVLMWSAKAGCTFATKWFLTQIGQLETALVESKDGWVHDYRAKHFGPDESYIKKLLAARGDSNWNYIQFVRNPVSRAVSCYLAYTHAAATQSKTREHSRVLKDLAAFLGRDISNIATFSFVEFLEWIQQTPQDAIDFHMLPQTINDYWLGHSEVVYIPIERAGGILPEIEKRFGLKKTDPAVLSSSVHHTRGERIDCSGVSALWFGESVRSPVPSFRSFVDVNTAPLLLLIYGEDIEKLSGVYPDEAKALLEISDADLRRVE